MEKPQMFDLDRFVEAQASAYAQAQAELATGSKRSHWMWFIFPQVRGLGSSAMSQRYAISGLEEARAYLHHPVLGPRLRECTSLVNTAESGSLQLIFGYPDDLKFHSSVTLFAIADEGNRSIFREALDNFWKGEMDRNTLAALALTKQEQ